MKRKMWSMCALVLVLMMLVSFPGVTGAALGITETDTMETVSIRMLTEDFFEKKQQNFVSKENISLVSSVQHETSGADIKASEPAEPESALLCQSFAVLRAPARALDHIVILSELRSERTVVYRDKRYPL